jgi:hypothetical protein
MLGGSLSFIREPALQIDRELVLAKVKLRTTICPFLGLTHNVTGFTVNIPLEGDWGPVGDATYRVAFEVMQAVHPGEDLSVYEYGPKLMLMECKIAVKIFFFCNMR